MKLYLDGKKFAAALKYGVETAYKAVMKPVEGTILTVAKDAANVGVEVAATTDDFIEVMEAIVREAKASLERTPDLLAVLKEVGVVDSGGQGLVYVYEGFLASLKGEGLPERTDDQAMSEMINARTSSKPSRVYEYRRYYLWLLHRVHGEIRRQKAG